MKNRAELLKLAGQASIKGRTTMKTDDLRRAIADVPASVNLHKRTDAYQAQTGKPHLTPKQSRRAEQKFQRDLKNAMKEL